MTELLSSAQMRAIERAAIGSGAVTGLELMERAGRGVVEAILAEWPDLARGGEAGAPPAPVGSRTDGAPTGAPGYLGQEEAALRAVVLCGPGNNGGDGFVVARLLTARGWEVEVYLYGDPARLPPDAAENFRRWRGMGEVRPLGNLAGLDGQGGLSCDVIVDALFGTGLARCLPEAVAEVLRDISAGDPAGRVVAVDIPSGLCADSGKWLVPEGYVREEPLADGLAVEPSLTVTFHRRKLGHVLNAAAEGRGGRLVVVDIGLEGGRPADGGVALVEEVRPPCGLGKGDGNKFSHGHALILSGPAGQGGAARLSARGALRIGAGLATLGCPPGAVAENAARLDAVMLRPVADAAALAEVLEDRRINALCLGPGLGLGAREVGLVAAALRAGRPTVLDADALTLVSRDPALFDALHEACVLTPHGGEFARLFPDIAERLAAPATSGPAFSKADAAREAAARAGCVVLLKGPDTVIADPAGRCAVNAAVHDRAAPWLATAGAGDVLAGFIAGLLARGFAPFEAACAGAWLHVECARAFGPGLIAEDLPEELPKVFRTLGL